MVSMVSVVVFGVFGLESQLSAGDQLRCPVGGDWNLPLERLHLLVGWTSAKLVARTTEACHVVVCLKMGFAPVYP